MTYTEDDLRTLLAERSADDPGGPPETATIVRRGRGIRLRRGLTSAVLVGAVTLGAFWMVQRPEPVVTPVTPATRIPLPATAQGMPLVKSVQGEDFHATVPLEKGRKAVLVKCADPKAWVVRMEGNGGVGTVGPCIPETGDQTGPKRTEEVWVLPKDAPVAFMSPGEARKKGCELMCEGKYLATELLRPGVLRKMIAELGPERAPAFAVGVYAGDRILPDTIKDGRFVLGSAHWAETMGAHGRIPIFPVKGGIAQVVKCQDPAAWVFRAYGGERAGLVGRCGEQRTPIWRHPNHPKYVDVWVFPADAPIRGSIDRAEADSLRKKLGPSEGAWAFGVYYESQRD